MAKPTAVALKEGDAAPDVYLETARGEKFQLSSVKGKNVILYFYPRADTPGYTVEACEFRDAAKEFDQSGSIIIGVSPDAMAAQSKFKNKYGLPFTLLCDIDRSAAEAYGVLKEKNLYGRKVMGIQRATFVIGKDGRIKKIFSNVRPQGHAQQVLDALSAL
jgi:peroxiredoxin Q/BCP